MKDKEGLKLVNPDEKKKNKNKKDKLSGRLVEVYLDLMWLSGADTRLDSLPYADEDRVDFTIEVRDVLRGVLADASRGYATPVVYEGGFDIIPFDEKSKLPSGSQPGDIRGLRSKVEFFTARLPAGGPPVRVKVYNDITKAENTTASAFATELAHFVILDLLRQLAQPPEKNPEGTIVEVVED
jgi:hypothetical protein